VAAKSRQDTRCSARLPSLPVCVSVRDSSWRRLTTCWPCPGRRARARQRARQAAAAPGQAWAQYIKLFDESRFVHVTTLDCGALTLFCPFWMWNDAQRRGWGARCAAPLRLWRGATLSLCHSSPADADAAMLLLCVDRCAAQQPGQRCVACHPATPPALRGHGRNRTPHAQLCCVSLRLLRSVVPDVIGLWAVTSLCAAGSRGTSCRRLWSGAALTWFG